MQNPVNLHQLNVFLAVAQEKSFSKAAASLRISQPSVSMQIKTLEESLGVKLFDRLARVVYLTDEGQLVMEYAKRMSGWISNLRSDLEDFKGVKVGHLVVGASRVPSSTTVPMAFALFKQKYPQTEIVVRAELSRQVEQWVLENDVDLGIVGGDPTSDLIVKEPYYEEELLAVLCCRHRLAKQKEILPEQIVQEPFLLPYVGRVTEFTADAFAQKGLFIEQQIGLGSREAVKAALSAGFGVSIMPQTAIEPDLKGSALVTKRIHGMKLKYPVNIIHHRDKHLSRLALTFLDFLRSLKTSATLKFIKPALVRKIRKSPSKSRRS